ncbi:MAG: hypothetical protein AAB874_07415 [Patescibacteria group bacterium]
MLKNIVAPVQTWLLSQNRCVGCGMPLSQGSKREQEMVTIITCKCKRMYVFDKTKKTYRRALLTEV